MNIEPSFQQLFEQDSSDASQEPEVLSYEDLSIFLCLSTKSCSCVVSEFDRTGNMSWADTILRCA